MSKLWGGRFSKKTNKLVEKFTTSIAFDQKLAKHDCLGSLYHIDVLKRAKLLTQSEHAKLRKGLKTILASIERGTFFKNIDTSFEDIHSYIQHLLEKKAGKAALKLHTCRSRNDQVVFATKSYCLDHLHATSKLLSAVQSQLKRLAHKNRDVIMPGYTHLQHAIPVRLSAHLLAYQEMLARDNKRILNAKKNIHLTLGAGALAGTFIPASKYSSGKGSKTVISAPDNTLDSVSDRDFVIEILGATATIGMHLSRIAEDMILWTSKEFDFIDIDDAFCTGSSLMPQKKNPDVLELIRGYTGQLYADLLNVLVVMKGLPLTYNRDMQHDKKPLLSSFGIIEDSLEIFTELLKNIKFKKANIRKQMGDEALYATDIADYLVQNGVAFKNAHQIIGKLVQHTLKNNVKIVDLDDKALEKFHPKLKAKVVRSIIDPKKSVSSKRSSRKRP